MANQGIATGQYYANKYGAEDEDLKFRFKKFIKKVGKGAKKGLNVARKVTSVAA